MKIPKITSRVGGVLSVAIIRKGKRIPVAKVKNLILNTAYNSQAQCLAFAAGANAGFTTYEGMANTRTDLDGTWTQSNGSGGPGNTVTRASGTGTFPSSPSMLGLELKFQDGERCHVTARASDTSITVSGPARYLVGKTLSRYNTTGVSLPATKQTGNSATSSPVYDHASGVVSQSWTGILPSATSAYSLNGVRVSIGASGIALVYIASPVAVAVDDQLEMTYTITLTQGTRSFDYDLGSEATGLPTQYTASTITGNGTYFDIVTSANNHFLAGDQILLENFVPKRFAISSASSTSSDFTINTSAAHGLAVSDSITIENATPSAYNGTWTVATVPDADTITVTSAVNPGAMGAVGTVRLATPVTYFNGTWTVASKPTAATIRVTSAITGPAIDPKTFGSVRGVRWDLWGGAGLGAQVGANAGVSSAFYFNETNAKSIPATSSTTTISTTGKVDASSTPALTPAAYTNDWSASIERTWNAGTAESRLKQIAIQYVSNANGGLLTFDVPQSKTTSDRLRLTSTSQIVRELP